jgi:hypothetical protein
MRGQFRTKSLRHVAETGPYFHDGSAATLEDVIQHYNQGGTTEGYPGVKDDLIVPLNLSEGEIADLVEFLEFRTSNFLIWQGAYAEYYVTPTLWPDFDKEELYKALVTYGERNRRYGGVNS